MIHERNDKYEGQDDSEYHFSDDQANYEVEPESIKTPSGGGQATAALAIIKQYKRPLIGIGVFFVLIFLVYKILAPSTSAPTTDFTPAGPGTVTKNVTQPTETTQATPPSQTVAAPAPIAAPEPQQAAIAPPQQPSPSATVTTTTTVAPSQPQMAPPSMPAPTTMATPQQPMPGMTMDRSASSITQQPAMPGDYAQKIAEIDAQNMALQGKLQDLNMRMASIENTLLRLGKLMQDMKGGSSSGNSMAPSSAPRAPRADSGPKVIYSVQAIIPGRAWLKSESGETVTVAEGDVIRDFGRVLKIDPYDGVVQIEAGGRVLSLSYGSGND